MEGNQPSIEETTPGFIKDVVETNNIYGVTWFELMFKARKMALECQSANAVKCHPADIARMRATINEIRDHQEWATQRPDLDLPHSRDRTYKIRFVGLEAVTTPQNRFWRDAARLWDLCINETTEGNTLRETTGLDKFDLARANAIQDEILDLLERAEAFSPMDKPEVFPNEPRTSPGSQNSAPEYAVTLGDA